MKKILVLIIILLIILFNSFSGENKFSLRDYFSSGTLTEYSANINPVSTNIKKKLFKQSKKDLIGESICFENCEVGDVIKTLDAEVKFTEFVESKGLTVIYCFTKKIKDSVITKNKKVNLQIASCENYTVVGWPMILGSF